MKNRKTLCYVVMRLLALIYVAPNICRYDNWKKYFVKAYLVAVEKLFDYIYFDKQNEMKYFDFFNISYEFKTKQILNFDNDLPKFVRTTTENI